MTQSEVTQSMTVLPVKPGELVDGKYRVENLLGSGGMGAVVSARHLKLEQLVAIKFLYTHAQNHPEAIARFDREARAVVRLKSQHVARVLDVGRLEDGAPFIVMEHLEGSDLADVLAARGPLPVTDAIDFVLQACEAIGEAHSLGIVHRDLKPKNLFLTRDARGLPLVKVLDFGISKTLTGESELSLTRTQSVIGSPNYMSPEQLRSSRDVDVRTDIWSLGAILYELLTGAVPFPAETVTQLTAMVIADPPTPLESYRQDVPAELRAVILRCLEKNRDARFANVAELASALLPFAAAGAHFSVPPHSSQDVLSISASSAPKDRPSIRVKGETSSAWGDTQLAPPPTRQRRWPMFVGASAIVLVGVVVFVSTRHHDVGADGESRSPKVEAKSDPPPTAPATSVAPTVSAPTPLTLLDVPSSRSLPPPNPLISPTGGPVRPLPTSLTQPKKDAGSAASAATTTTPPPTSDDLPSVRH